MFSFFSIPKACRKKAKTNFQSLKEKDNHNQHSSSEDDQKLHKSKSNLSKEYQELVQDAEEGDDNSIVSVEVWPD